MGFIMVLDSNSLIAYARKYLWPGLVKVNGALRKYSIQGKSEKESSAVSKPSQVTPVRTLSYAIYPIPIFFKFLLWSFQLGWVYPYFFQRQWIVFKSKYPLSKKKLALQQAITSL
jgi:hypothetical protein